MPETSNNYNPTTWITGDTITAEKLNNLEQGIQNATSSNRLYLCTNTSRTLDRTYNDIKNALLANKNIFLLVVDEGTTYYQLLIYLNKEENTYSAKFYNGGTYRASSADAYLVLPNAI